MLNRFGERLSKWAHSAAGALTGIAAGARPESNAKLERAEALQRRDVAPADFERFRGDFAVVTGGSRGLGFGYAWSLAARGVNLLLVARDETQLLDAAQRIRQAHGAIVETVSADFENSQFMERVTAAARRLPSPVSVLINNVGGAPKSSREPGAFAYTLDPHVYRDYFLLNAMAAIRMTHWALPGMLKRNRGYVLNVSSMNGLTAIAGLGPYCAAKAYLISYTACLARELERFQSDVAVDCVCPGQVATDGIGRAGESSEQVPDPIEFAEQSLRFARSRYAKVPWFEHWKRRRRYGRSGHFDL